MENPAEFFLWYVVFLFSTVVHEAAHAYAAMKLGDFTAYHEGQVSLDPRPHIKREIFGTIIVPCFSFLVGGWMIGWASTPYDPAWARRYPHRSAWMAAAGPCANLAIVIVAAIIIKLGVFRGVFFAPHSAGFSHITAAANAGMPSTFATLLSIFFSLNLILFFFNLLPFPPLDGSGIIPLFLKEEQAIGYMDFLSNPGLSILGLLIAWEVFPHLLGPAHLMFLNLLYPGAAYH